MSLDLDFNISLSKEEIEEKTPIKVHIIGEDEYLVDEYDNVVTFNGYGITIRGQNPYKILDELIQVFNIMFIDDEAMDQLREEPEKQTLDEVYETTMIRYDYSIVDGKVIIPKRTEDFYKPYVDRVIVFTKDDDTNQDDDDELPF
jgi:hypothetical protein